LLGRRSCWTKLTLSGPECGSSPLICSTAWARRCREKHFFIARDEQELDALVAAMEVMTA